MSRILVLDDDAEVRGFIRDQLLACRHEVAEATVSWTAIARFDSFQPDVVVCDTGPLGAHSLSIVQAMAGRNPAMRLVALGQQGADEVSLYLRRELAAVA